MLSARTFYFLSGFLLLLASVASAGIVPLDLRCGSWENPMGMDEPRPRLGWRLQTDSETERGKRQTAYQILVASSRKLLDGGQGDLWDTGKVASDKMQATYGGFALASSQQVFWKVRVWDEKAHRSVWSPEGNWTMGLLNIRDWQGKWLCAKADGPDVNDCSWIWYPEGSPSVSAPAGTRYFRKEFSVAADLSATNAELLLSADNSYTVYINGVQAGQATEWQTITPVLLTAQLRKGTNTLAILAVNSGKTSSSAGVIGKLTIRGGDGSERVIKLDPSWKTSNKLEPGWQMPGFDDSSWPHALVLGNYGIKPWEKEISFSKRLPIFRRQFFVKSGLQRALIHICGLGKYDLYANGKKVGDALIAPGWTKYDKTCLYDTLDLGPYLNSGTNAVGVMLGNGMYNVQPGGRYAKFSGSFRPAKLIAQIELFYKDGSSDVIPTDAQWLTTQGPITFSSVYGGEDYDTRLEPIRWDQTNADLSGSDTPVIASGPGGILRGCSFAAPPLKAIETLPPFQVNHISHKTTIYDLGQNASIIPRLCVYGEAGSVVRIIPAELTNLDGTVNRGSCGGGVAYWQYTLAGGTNESWQSHFFYHGSRYLQVELIAAPGSSRLPEIESLNGVVIQSSCPPVGNFACSEDLFNRVRTLIRWAQRNNLVSVLTDCPHRERLGWLEQYHLNGPSLRYEFDLSQLYTKTMQDMADSQTGAGLMPDIAPEYVVFSNGFRDSPEWGSSCILVPWQQYLWTGDDTLLRRYYQTMTNYLAYLQGRATNNILSYGLGDWFDRGPGPLGEAQLTPIPFTATAYLYQDTCVLAAAAALLGFTNDSVRFASQSEKVRSAFNQKFYNPISRSYATGSQTAQALALVLNLVEPENRSNVVAALVSNVRSQGLTAGDIGHRYLLRALADAGRSDVIFDLHSQTNKPGYGYILNKGATSLTEGWDGSFSQDHFMLGQIMEWFYHDLAGIQPDPHGPGFAKIVVKPAFVDGITWAKATNSSPRGTIISGWAVTNYEASLSVSIPANSTGEIYLPTKGTLPADLVVKEGKVSIWKNGAVGKKDRGVSFGRLEADGSETFLVWNVGSGNYRFSWNVH